LASRGSGGPEGESTKIARCSRFFSSFLSAPDPEYPGYPLRIPGIPSVDTHGYLWCCHKFVVVKKHQDFKVIPSNLVKPAGGFSQWSMANIEIAELIYQV